MIISITGLKPKSFWHTLPFWYRAIPSFNQAKKAPGNLFCEVRQIQGIQHTLTAWNNMESLRTFVGAGPHLKAVKSFRKIATGSTYHYESDAVPSWEEARQLWEANYKEY
jgi:hypothetical protein